MSCLPHFNVLWVSPPYYTRQWFLGDHSVYEQVTYIVVPLYGHPRAPISTPEISGCSANPFPAAPPGSSFAFNRHPRQNCYRYAAAGMNATAETNACKADALERHNTIQSSSDRNVAFNSHQLSSDSSDRSRFNKDMLNLMDSRIHFNARTSEHSGKNQYKSTVLNAAHKSEHSAKTEINNMSSEHQAGANCSISSQSCYLSFSELTLTKETLANLSSTVDEKCKSLCKEQQKISIPPEDDTDGDINVHIDEDLPHLINNQNDYRCSELDDDSQLEYHSAEEQDCVCHSSSYTQKKETSQTFHTKESASCMAGGQPKLNKLENKPNISHYYSFSERPELSQMFQDGNSKVDYCFDSDGQERHETVNMFCGNEGLVSVKASRENKNPKSFLVSKSGIDGKTKANSLTGATQTLQSPVLTSGVELDFLDPCAHEQSVALSAHGICTCKLHGGYEESFSNSELKRVKMSKSTVNQAVDATSDFRACFTTSRATNVKVTVMTRAQNTTITMMNKERPNKWLTDSHRSVSCNTDWTFISGNAKTTDSQIAVTDILENCGWKSKTEDPLECKNSRSKEFNEIPKRLMQLSQEISDHLPKCCKEICQRTVKAEMQLLNMIYQIYSQHCVQTSKDAMNEKDVNSSASEIVSSVSEVSLSENIEGSSHSLVTHQISENLNPSNNNAKEWQNDLIESGSSISEETAEDWFDATENLSVSDAALSSTGQLNLTEMQTVDDIKKVSKNNIFVHVGNLSPIVSEVDLWLHFHQYNVSSISICGLSENYRYASLSFKSASDASLAVKKVNGELIKGQAVKVRLVKTARENGVSHCKCSVKPEHECQRLQTCSEKTGKNCNVNLKVPPSALVSPRAVTSSPVSSKRPDASKVSIKFPSPAVSNVCPPTLESSKLPLCAFSTSKVPDSGFKFSKPSSRNGCFEKDQQDVAESHLLLGSVQCTPSPFSNNVEFPNTLNLKGFRKIVKNLEVLHPEVSRDNIVNALLEVKEQKGLLGGLPLSTIVEMASSLLNKKFTTKYEGNGNNNLRNK
nr:PREDICTED: RNA-binding protein 44 isoform X2 [Anolis carolinensis]|eukprot:XP_016850696.1 PREDICTED: RNA-binding protein 44 isoform X2 [Anolis carolinensis]